MVDQRSKELRGTSGVTSLRWSATVAACLGLERSRLLNVLNDTAGTCRRRHRAVQHTSVSSTSSTVSGGLRTGPSPSRSPAVGRQQRAVFALRESAGGVDAAGYDKPFVYGPDTLRGRQNSSWRMSAFVAAKTRRTPSSRRAAHHARSEHDGRRRQRRDPAGQPARSCRCSPWAASSSERRPAPRGCRRRTERTSSSASSTATRRARSSQAEGNGPLAESPTTRRSSASTLRPVETTEAQGSTAPAR